MTSSEQIQDGFQDTRYSLLCCKYKVNNYYNYYLNLNQLVSNFKQKSINDSVNDQDDPIFFQNLREQMTMFFFFFFFPMQFYLQLQHLFYLQYLYYTNIYTYNIFTNYTTYTYTT